MKNVMLFTCYWSASFSGDFSGKVSKALSLVTVAILYLYKYMKKRKTVVFIGFQLMPEVFALTLKLLTLYRVFYNRVFYNRLKG